MFVRKTPIRKSSWRRVGRAKMLLGSVLKMPGNSLVFWEQLSWAGSRVLAARSTVPKGDSQPSTRASPGSVPQGVPRVGTAWLALLST